MEEWKNKRPWRILKVSRRNFTGGTNIASVDGTVGP